MASTLDFYSKLIKIDGGHARDVVWHQYKQQYRCIYIRLGAIKGEDKNGKIVEYITEKKGFMGRGEYFWFELDA